MEKHDNCNNPVTSISIIRQEETFTPYVFYTKFLDSVSQFYACNKNTIIKFQLTQSEENQYEITSEDINKSKKYRIDPIAIPLLLSISEQFKKVHKSPIKLDIIFNNKTYDLLKFLRDCDFFYIAGNDIKNNINPQYPKGLDIFDYNHDYLKLFLSDTNKHKEFHKLRAYSGNLPISFLEMSANEARKRTLLTEEKTRDWLENEFSKRASEDFLEIFERMINDISDRLDDDLNTKLINFRSSCGDTIGQLVSNGIIYSSSDVFSMLSINKYAIKIAVSDNGVGFETTLKEKKDFRYGELTKLFKSKKSLIFISENKLKSLTAIFEALFYSITKYRYGLFDLMCTSVLNLNGSFRLHTNFTQIIISDRMSAHLQKLKELREPIRNCYGLKDNNYTIEKTQEFAQYIQNAQDIFVDLFNETVDKYNQDVIYSSIKFYKGPFLGVHCEVEIPLL